MVKYWIVKLKLTTILKWRFIQIYWHRSKTSNSHTTIEYFELSVWLSLASSYSGGRGLWQAWRPAHGCSICTPQGLVRRCLAVQIHVCETQLHLFDMDSCSRDAITLFLKVFSLGKRWSTNKCNAGHPTIKPRSKNLDQWELQWNSTNGQHNDLSKVVVASVGHILALKILVALFLPPSSQIWF